MNTDETFRAMARVYLAGIRADHAELEDGRCSAGDRDVDDPDELAQGFRGHLLDAIAAGVAPAALAPHRVKIPASAWSSTTDTVATPADDADPRPKGSKVKGRVYEGPTDCPDCGGGLASLGDAGFICLRVDRNAKVPGSGGIVACGVKTDG